MSEIHAEPEPSAAAAPRQIPIRTRGTIEIPTPALPAPNSSGKMRNSHLNIDTFSPVNQNGSFEFDRVLKNGYVQKRTRKTKAWKPIYLVLRPNTLSIYKDHNEDKLRHKIQLSDLTAVTFLKDPKQKRQNLLGLFSPSRNYHLEAESQKDAQEWLDLIRREARIEEEEEEMMLASPTAQITGSYGGFERAMQTQEAQRLHDERLGSSSPEPTDPISRPLRSQPFDPNAPRRPSHTIEYSGNEVSDLSDAADISRKRGMSSVSIPEEPLAVKSPPTTTNPSSTSRPFVGRNVSEMSVEQDPERIVWQGHLLLLKSIRGVRQWKDLWVVIRAKTITFYKNDSEYSPHLVIPLSSVINAVEIDPLSKSKNHCLQIITEEKSYKFCARDEDALDKSLGAFKSLLARRKEKDLRNR